MLRQTPTLIGPARAIRDMRPVPHSPEAEQTSGMTAKVVRTAEATGRAELPSTNIKAATLAITTAGRDSTIEE